MPGDSEQRDGIPPTSRAKGERDTVMEAVWRLHPAGSFVMGSPEREPGHTPAERQRDIVLTRPFLMKATTVTHGEWRLVFGASKPQGPSLSLHPVEPDDATPVVDLNWFTAVKLCNVLSEGAGLPPAYELTDESGTPGTRGYRFEAVAFHGLDSPAYRLPTEAEWEYACRAGSTTAFCSGPCTRPEGEDPNLATVAWFLEEMGIQARLGREPHAVARKSPNAWGLYDMHGNVGEWCWDSLDEADASGETDPVGPTTEGGFGRAIRGGHCCKLAFGCRSAARTVEHPSFASPYVGVRPCRTANDD